MFEPPPAVLLENLLATRIQLNEIIESPLAEDSEREDAKKALFGVETQIQEIQGQLRAQNAESEITEGEGRAAPDGVDLGSSGTPSQEDLKAAAQAETASQKRARKKKATDEVPGYKSTVLPNGEPGPLTVGQAPPPGGYPVLGDEDNPLTYNYWLEVGKRFGVKPEELSALWGNLDNGEEGQDGLERMKAFGKAVCEQWPIIDVYTWCQRFCREKSIPLSMMQAVWLKYSNTELPKNWDNKTAKDPAVYKHEIAKILVASKRLGLDLSGLEMVDAAAEIADRFLSLEDDKDRYRREYNRQVALADESLKFLDEYLLQGLYTFVEQNKVNGSKYVQLPTGRLQLRTINGVERVCVEASKGGTE